MSKKLDKKGLKETKIGPIPKEWDCIKLGDHCIVRGRIGWKGLKQSEYKEDGPYLIASKHIDGGRVSWENCDHISEERYEESSEIALECGDVIFSKDGALGNPALIDKLPDKATINSTMMLLRPNGTIDSSFLYQILNSRLFDRLILEKVSGGAIPHIFQRDMKDFEMPSPPKLEQQKIALILSTWDKAIEKTEQLIVQKQQLKKGLMQQLLTGKVRFKEFKEKWKKKRIEELGAVIRGASPRPKGDPRYYGGKVPRLMVEDVTRDGKYVTPCVDFLTEEGAKLSRPCKAGTLTIVCSGDVGTPAFLAVDACIHDGFLAVVDLNKEIDKDYLYYQMLRLKAKIERSATHGGVFTNLTTQILKDFEIPVPSIEEQRRISGTISRMDHELSQQQELLLTLHSQKRGLLQKLLTGEVRVKLS